MQIEIRILIITHEITWLKNGKKNYKKKLFSREDGDQLKRKEMWIGKILEFLGNFTEKIVQY